MSKFYAQLSDYLPWMYLVEEGVSLNKDGSFHSVFEVSPHDLAFADDYDVYSTLNSIFNMHSPLGDGWCMYIDGIRTKFSNDELYFDPNAPAGARDFDRIRSASMGRQSYDNKFFISFLYRVPRLTMGKKMLLWLDADKKSRKHILNDVEIDSFSDGLAHFNEVISGLGEVLGRVFRQSSLLSSSRMLGYFHSTFSSYRDHINVPPMPDVFIDKYLSSVTVESERFLKVGDEYVGCATIHSYPGESEYSLYSLLLRIPEDVRFVSRFICVSRDKAKRIIERMRDVYHRKQSGVKSHIASVITASGDTSGLVDTSATLEVHDLNQALSTTRYSSFGYFTHTVIVKDTDPARLSSRLEKIKGMFGDAGYVVKLETANNLFAWFGAIPGNIGMNARRAIISVNNWLHWFPLSGLWKGPKADIHLRSLTGVSAPTMQGVTYGEEIFNVSFFQGDVGHSIVIGQTGAGKSVFLALAAMQWFGHGTKDVRPGVVVFDVDASSKRACNLCDGLFFDVGGAAEHDDSFVRSIKFNVFQRLRAQEGRSHSDIVSYATFLSNLIVDMVRSRGIEVSPVHSAVLYTALVDMSGSKNCNWTALLGGINDDTVRRWITPFVDGEYADLFSSDDEQLEESRFLVFEMRSLLSRSPELIKFVLFYIFYCVEQTFDGSPVLLILDEAWRFLDDPTFSGRIRDWLKTLRKRNVAVCLSTQEVADLSNSPIFPVIAGSCPNRIFTANSSANNVGVREAYLGLGLLPVNLNELATMAKQKYYLLNNPSGTQRVDFRLDSEQLSYLTNPKKIVSEVM